MKDEYEDEYEREQFSSRLLHLSIYPKANMDGTTTGSDNRVGIQLKLLSRLLKWSKSKKKAADVHRPNLDLNIEHCDVCYDENLMGYKLACGHSRCVNHVSSKQ